MTFINRVTNSLPAKSYCLDCTKFGQLIFGKIIKIVATSCQILRLKCIKFNFSWGSAPDPTGGAYSTPPYLLAGFKGPTSKVGKEAEGEEEGKGRYGRGMEGGGRDKGGGWSPCTFQTNVTPMLT